MYNNIKYNRKGIFMQINNLSRMIRQQYCPVTKEGRMRKLGKTRTYFYSFVNSFCALANGLIDVSEACLVKKERKPYVPLMFAFFRNYYERKPYQPLYGFLSGPY